MSSAFKSILGAAALAVTAAASPVIAATTIDTTQPYTDSWSPFGSQGTSAYGQTFTAGADNILDSFSLFLTGSTSNPVDFRAFIYAWDGSKATGPQLFASSLQSFLGSFAENPVEFIFNTGGISLTPGSQYVAFLFADKSGPQGSASMPFAGSFGSEQLPGGSFVFFNSDGSFDLLTSGSWDKSGGSDDVWFKASFSAESVGAVPEPATWIMFLAGFFAVGGAMRASRRRAKPARLTA